MQKHEIKRYACSLFIPQQIYLSAPRKDMFCRAKNHFLESYLMPLSIGRVEC